MMIPDHFKLMTQALHTESLSQHPTHKVGALIHGEDKNGESFVISESNFWPKALELKIGRDQKLGNASTTVHAEIAAILNSPQTNGADIYITNLPCPNCAKALVEAGIKTVYIDITHSERSELSIKMKPFFDAASFHILGSAGIAVHEINMKTQAIRAIITPDAVKPVDIEHPIVQKIVEPAAQTIDGFFKNINQHNYAVPFAACYARTPNEELVFISAAAHLSAGLSWKQAETIINMQKKYQPTLQPINRLILNVARYGLEILPDYLYSSQCPTSREFVNMTGAGLSSLYIDNTTLCRDKAGLIALKQLKEHNILTIKTPI